MAHAAQPLAEKIDTGFKRILIATHFSDSSQRTLPFALSLAKRYESEVYLVHIVESRSDRRRFDADQELNHMAEAASFQGISVHPIVGLGRADERLAAEVADNDINLLVLGTRDGLDSGS